MSAYPKETAEAAKWLWDRKHVSIDWNWPVLTKHNPDSETLGYPEVQAYQIFTILEKKGLIEPFAFTANGQQISSFKLCLEDEKKWKSTTTPPSWYRKIGKSILFLFGGAWRFLFWLITLIVTVFITTNIQEAVKKQYKEDTAAEVENK